MERSHLPLLSWCNQVSRQPNTGHVQAREMVQGLPFTWATSWRPAQVTTIPRWTPKCVDGMLIPHKIWQYVASDAFLSQNGRCNSWLTAGFCVSPIFKQTQLWLCAMGISLILSEIWALVKLLGPKWTGQFFAPNIPFWCKISEIQIHIHSKHHQISISMGYPKKWWWPPGWTLEMTIKTTISDGVYPLRKPKISANPGSITKHKWVSQTSRCLVHCIGVKEHVTVEPPFYFTGITMVSCGFSRLTQHPRVCSRHPPSGQGTNEQLLTREDVARLVRDLHGLSYGFLEPTESRTKPGHQTWLAGKSPINVEV